MAESSFVVNRQLLFDMDGDTPIPAAEVLVDLKRSTRHHNVTSYISPRKHKNYNNHKDTTRREQKTLWRYSNDIVSYESDEEETFEAPPVSKRSKRSFHRNQTHTNDSISKVPWTKQIKTFLRLPKALTWCRYEWFCSDIDKPFLGGENDFCHCLNEMFPRLKTRNLSIMQWRIIRRMIGKPRRCSSTFFAEERTVLTEKRRRLRELQRKVHQGTQLSLADFNHFRDLPENIPAMLTVGTKVIAWLNIEKDKGFHAGTIEAVDRDENKYWVTFDKQDIGKHSIPDTDIKSVTPCEMISLSSLEAVHTNRHLVALPPSTPPRAAPVLSSSSQISTNTSVLDPLLASSPSVSRGRISSNDQQHSLGGFPTDLLRQVVQMSKLLSLKQDRVRRMSFLNKDAEKMHARHIPLSPEFQKHYATIVIDLDDINRQLNMRSEAVKKYCSELGYEDEPHQLASTQECMQHALEITHDSNVRLKATGSEVKDESILTLISKLTSILLQIELQSQGTRSYEFSGLQNSITETSFLVHNDNQKLFQKHIETPLALIQSGMNPSDSLHPFSVSVSKKPNRTKSSKI